MEKEREREEGEVLEKGIWLQLNYGMIEKGFVKFKSVVFKNYFWDYYLSFT